MILIDFLFTIARDRAKREMVKFSKANKSLERAKSADVIVSFKELN